jgi:hypothetical protein
VAASAPTATVAKPLDNTRTTGDNLAYATPEKPYVPGGGVARARKFRTGAAGAGLGLLPLGGAGGGFRCWQVYGKVERAARS